MARRGDTNLVASDNVVMKRKTLAGREWRGLSLPPSATFSICDIRRFSNFRHFPSDCGWMVEAPAGTCVHVAIVASDDGRLMGEALYSGPFQPLLLPWPQQVCGKVDLVVSCKGMGDAAAFIANHRLLSRKWLYDLCVGRGIEIGPGPVPQILPTDDRVVSYLEQMPAEEWNRLYNGGGKYPTRPELWDRYIVGEASALPVADGALEFIFGSHVFEHLVNPLGHLAHWKSKLAKGGKVIMVIPDLNGTKDAVHHQSSLTSLIDEFERQIWLPEVFHYVRHLRRVADDRHLVAAMERKESIHAHYYDNGNCQAMLDFAVRELGYSDYIIEHTPNHKDFHFVLES